MAPNRLSALDASFLDVATASAHMHVGWAAAVDPPDGRPAPSFEQLRDHIARRLQRAPATGSAWPACRLGWPGRRGSTTTAST